MDTAREIGHGNLDNYLIPVVAEEVRRSWRLALEADASDQDISTNTKEPSHE